MPAATRKNNEPTEWQDGQAAARRAREDVVEQLGTLIIGLDMTGSASNFAHRLRQLADARREGDREVLRGAVMEVAVACAMWAVALDLKQPRRRDG